MHTFDQFELVDELQATALGATSVARLTEGGGEFVVKAFCPSPDLMSEAEVGRRAAAFLDRVRIQQAVVQSGAAQWAEIRDAGPIDGGAFYAVARYPFSARKLIVGRARISASDLAQIVGGIAEGLSELKRFCGRAHGNLKPSNILLEKPRGSGTIRVRLTDPADAQHAAGAGAESEDLYALGRLLFELVTLRPCSGAAAWPVVDSDLWSRLGPTAQRWRELCSWLVHPCPEEGSRNLDQLHRQLLTLAPRRRRSPSARVLAGVARDDARAAHWFGEAAKLGDPVAMRNLAGFYEAGRGGLARDLGQALTWRKQAAFADDEESKRWPRAHPH